jgi:tRNA(Arg) A34 adenosine deaminase TadA
MPTTAGVNPLHPPTLISSILKTVEDRIIPLTQRGVSSGSKVFGAAILSRTDFLPITVATNNERTSPLLHGEIACIQQFFTVDYPDATTRPDLRKDCIFFATHEPCSLCLSGIAWSGFSEFYYLFTYEDSRDLFEIPYDIEILEEVFRVRTQSESEIEMKRRALYNRTNKFFTATSVGELLEEIEDVDERKKWMGEVTRVKSLYSTLSETYQDRKKTGEISSSVWK